MSRYTFSHQMASNVSHTNQFTSDSLDEIVKKFRSFMINAGFESHAVDRAMINSVEDLKVNIILPKADNFTERNYDQFEAQVSEFEEVQEKD